MCGGEGGGGGEEAGRLQFVLFVSDFDFRLFPQLVNSLSPSHENQVDVIEVFKSASRH